MSYFNSPRSGHPSVNPTSESHLAAVDEECSCFLLEQSASLWPLDTPPLRYDVASLEHWLDLNA